LEQRLNACGGVKTKKELWFYSKKGGAVTNEMRTMGKTKGNPKVVWDPKK